MWSQAQAKVLKRSGLTEEAFAKMLSSTSKTAQNKVGRLKAPLRNGLEQSRRIYDSNETVRLEGTSGSLVPGAGTAVGGIVGGLIRGTIGYMAGSTVTQLVHDFIFTSGAPLN